MDVETQDQADTLRTFASVQRSPEQLAAAHLLARPRVIAVASGKGGVGKTQLVANLAVAYARRGARVLAVDGDLGLANLDLALGAAPERTLLDVVRGDVGVDTAITLATDNVDLLAAFSGDYDIANLAAQARHALFAAIDSLEEDYDTLIVDTGAGIGSNAMAFAVAAEHLVVVANPEPTSLADAYAFIKVAATRFDVKRVHLVANMVRNPAEGEAVYGRICEMAARFLDVALDYAGSINRDSAVHRAVQSGVPLLVGEPQSTAAQCIGAIAARIATWPSPVGSGGIRLFWKRLLEGRGTQ